MNELPKYNPLLKIGDPFSFYLIECNKDGCSDPGFTKNAVFYKMKPQPIVGNITSFKEGNDKL
jgi:hypothetical protein